MRAKRLYLHLGCSRGKTALTAAAGQMHMPIHNPRGGDTCACVYNCAFWQTRTREIFFDRNNPRAADQDISPAKILWRKDLGILQDREHLAIPSIKSNCIHKLTYLRSFVSTLYKQVAHIRRASL
jgi:hypothetical protein